MDCRCVEMELSINGGSPLLLDGLFHLFHGQSIYKWMMTGGTPMT